MYWQMKCYLMLKTSVWRLGFFQPSVFLFPTCIIITYDPAFTHVIASIVGDNEFLFGQVACEISKYPRCLF